MCGERRKDPFLNLQILKSEKFNGCVTFHRITESQNGRGWKGPLWVIPPKQGHLR